VKLYFFERGTELSFWMERQADTINIRLVEEPVEDEDEIPYDHPLLNEAIRFGQETDAKTYYAGKTQT
jgi:hypothetical protein